MRYQRIVGYAISENCWICNSDIKTIKTKGRHTTKKIKSLVKGVLYSCGEKDSCNQHNFLKLMAMAKPIFISKYLFFILLK